jgi:hypothetical protein
MHFANGREAKVAMHARGVNEDVSSSDTPARPGTGEPACRGGTCGPAASRVFAPRLTTRGGLSDAQPDASRASGADVTGGHGYGREALDPSGRRDDQTRRCGSLYQGTLLSSKSGALSAIGGEVSAPAPVQLTQRLVEALSRKRLTEASSPPIDPTKGLRTAAGSRRWI